VLRTAIERSCRIEHLNRAIDRRRTQVHVRLRRAAITMTSELLKNARCAFAACDAFSQPAATGAPIGGDFAGRG
jgi:hypothetical protein